MASQSRRRGCTHYREALREKIVKLGCQQPHPHRPKGQHWDVSPETSLTGSGSDENNQSRPNLPVLLTESIDRPKNADVAFWPRPNKDSYAIRNSQFVSEVNNSAISRDTDSATSLAAPESRRQSGRESVSPTDITQPLFPQSDIELGYSDADLGNDDSLPPPPQTKFQSSDNIWAECVPEQQPGWALPFHNATLPLETTAAIDYELNVHIVSGGLDFDFQPPETTDTATNYTRGRFTPTYQAANPEIEPIFGSCPRPLSPIRRISRGDLLSLPLTRQLDRGILVLLPEINRQPSLYEEFLTKGYILGDEGIDDRSDADCQGSCTSYDAIEGDSASPTGDDRDENCDLIDDDDDDENDKYENTRKDVKSGSDIHGNHINVLAPPSLTYNPEPNPFHAPPSIPRPPPREPIPLSPTHPKPLTSNPTQLAQQSPRPTSSSTRSRERRHCSSPCQPRSYQPSSPSPLSINPITTPFQEQTRSQQERRQVLLDGGVAVPSPLTVEDVPSWETGPDLRGEGYRYPGIVPRGLSRVR